VQPDQWLGKIVWVPPVLRKTPDETAVVRGVDSEETVRLECSGGGWLRGVKVEQLVEVTS
jgi:hypothetical protein